MLCGKQGCCKPQGEAVPLPIETSNPASDWYALYTRHQHEKTVAQVLTRKGFEILLPLYESVRRWKDRTKVLSLPLFTCYVFLKGGLERRCEVLNTPGIYELLSTGGQPIAIPTAEIDAIQQVMKSGLRLEPHPFLKIGERVRIKRGPLAGLQGLLVRQKNVYRLVISVEMLGRAAVVEVDSFLVERLVKLSVIRHGVSAHVDSQRCSPIQ
jgi:transcription antitermination factor NusG